MTSLSEQQRAHNFNAGPAVLPEPVLEKVQREFLDFKGKKASVLEVSHRSDEWEETVAECEQRIRDLLDIPNNYNVLFLQGGASTQFAMIPMNIARSKDDPVQLVHTGRWSTKKVNELEIQNVDHEILANSEDTGHDRVPEFDEDQINPEAAYFHLCSNETIGGVQWPEYPDTGSSPLVADMSSDIMSRPIDVSQFGLIYGGAQKNIGPAGCTLVIIRDDLVERTPDDVPTMLRYDTHIKKDSMHNTPPVFPIYVINMVMQWLQDQGGLEDMHERNTRKAQMIYDTIDNSDLYEGAAHRDSRSIMNVTFRLETEQLEEEFLNGAERRNMIGLQGHRTVGGCRASIYNSSPVESVEALVEYMNEFESNL